LIVAAAPIAAAQKPEPSGDKGPRSAAKAATPKPTTIVLRKKSVKPDELRLVGDVRGKISAEAWTLSIPPATFVLFDLDCDGRLDGKDDGIALDGHIFVARRPKRLWCALGDCDYVIEKTAKATLTPRETAAPAHVVAAASALTELRLRYGAAPLELDDDACRACALHCDYLALNGGGGPGLSPHDEVEGRPGYTPEGAAAGAGSCIAPKPGDLRISLTNTFATAWHGIPLVDPSAVRVGVAHKHDFLLVYPLTKSDWDAVVLHPTDGARQVPRAFSPRGEAPNPAAGTRYGIGLGFPIMARPPWKDRNLPIERFEVRGPDKRGLHGFVWVDLALLRLSKAA
jgi:hypothetical protein